MKIQNLISKVDENARMLETFGGEETFKKLKNPRYDSIKKYNV